MPARDRYHDQVKNAISRCRRRTVFDRDQNHYLLMLVGWEGVRRVHGCLVHVDVIDGKFWIQRDGTEYSIAQEQLDAGVPKDRSYWHSARWRSAG
jgi:hypothetical protein